MAARNHTPTNAHRISAADNMIIETEPDRWRMLINTNFVENVQGDGILVEATDGHPLRYTTLFARTRRLPKGGQLETGYIQRVVLGWSWDDESWHLGLLLADQLAALRGSRWCEMAKWPDPEQDLYKELAVQAGEALARSLDRPFNLVPLREMEMETTPVELPLPSLPMELQGWTFQRVPTNNWLVFTRDKAWVRERTRRALWYALWAVIYVALSVATLMSDIALPRPAFLPYLGLVTAVLLAGLVVYSLYELRTKPQQIIVDAATRRVWGTAKQGAKPVWRKDRTEIDSVYVSEVVKLHTRKKTKSGEMSIEEPVAADIHHGEINLRLTDGTFFFLLKQDEPETIADPVRGVLDTVQPLERLMLTTKLQASAAHIAEALDVPLWYDCRSK